MDNNGPTDVYIAVLGATGVGKSTFISACAGEVDAVLVGHSLKSCTREIVDITIKFNDFQLHLIDTPGFDDDTLSDTEVLQQLSLWLYDTYQEDRLLNGIIFMHRISDTRMTGSARKHLRMFRKLCGPDAYNNVSLVTSMWDRVSKEEGERRENELKSTPQYWGTMCEKGSKVFRFQGTPDSGMEIISQILGMDKVKLQIQKEMVEERLELRDTSAGKELGAQIKTEMLRQLVEIERVQQDVAEAVQEDDKDMEKILRQELEELRKKYEQKVEEGKMLQDSLEAIRARLNPLETMRAWLNSRPVAKGWAVVTWPITFPWKVVGLGRVVKWVEKPFFGAI